MSDWGCCREDVNGDENVICNKCKKKFPTEYLRSGGTELQVFSDIDWVCLLCKNKTLKKDCTPVRVGNKSTSNNGANVLIRSNERQALSSPPTNVNNSLTQDDVRNIIRSEFAEMLSMMKSTLSIFSSELNSLKEDISCVKESMDFINSMFEDITRETNANTEIVNTLKSEYDSLNAAVANISNRFNQLDQFSRASNIEIQCVPERKNENLLTFIKQIGIVIGTQINKDQIMHCTRIAKLDKKSNRPRSIVVQFNTPLTRDSFLASVYKYNKFHSNDKLNSGHLGMPGDKVPIYIMEHLSPMNKALHAATRIKAKELGYDFVWVRGGRIFIRKNDASDHKCIRDMESVNKLS
ncbi:unnamed protein product [Diatraea saccharalis]|uniref:FP protein C-terminal domain-containing protein n=1 Tax=Diatraea saccharalis TaxID=40085 RepID=A0A9N9QKJ6_9NEOP|nr:unnamed protein product [Diatraea saccharalis]